MADPKTCAHIFAGVVEIDGRVEEYVGHRCALCYYAIVGDDRVIRDERTCEVLGHAEPPLWPGEDEDNDLYEDESSPILLEG